MSTHGRFAFWMLMLFCTSITGLAQARPNLDVNACDQLLNFGAIAYQRGTNDVLYTEQHRQCRSTDRPVWGEIRYIDPSGEQFAYKWLDYRAGRSTPDFELTDSRRGYREGATREGEQVVLHRKRGSADLQRARVSAENKAVIDSGFDEFVRSNMTRLLQEETVRLQFLVAGELNDFSFKAHGLRKVRWGDTDAYFIKVEHDSFFVRMLIDPILLWYDAESLRLLEYQGLSNISAASGDRFDARIVYPPEQFKAVQISE